jgi:hypothetical protein
MHHVTKWAFAGAIAVLAMGGAASAQQFVPSPGYADGPKDAPGVAPVADPTAPPLTRIPDASLAGLFQVVPGYAHPASVKVVGAFAVDEPAGVHLDGAWSRGFLPVTLSFSDGRCFSLTADYNYGTLSMGRLTRVGCDYNRPKKLWPAPPSPPADRALRLIGSSWGFGGWMDDQAGTTIVTPPIDTKAFEPFLTARMTSVAIMGQTALAYGLGNFTLVGRIDGRLTVVTLEVTFDKVVSDFTVRKACPKAASSPCSDSN